MNKTPIELTDFTINPFKFRNLKTGKIGHHCTKISPGCKKCYSSQMQGGPYLSGLTFIEENKSKGEFFLDRNALEQVLRRKKPARIFWCVSGDTSITMADGSARSVRQVRSGDRVLGVGDKGAVASLCSFAGETGIKSTVKLRLESGHVLRASSDHRVLTQRGYVEISNLTASDRVNILLPHGIQTYRTAISISATHADTLGIEACQMSGHSGRMQQDRSCLSVGADRRRRNPDVPEDEGRLLSANDEYHQHRRGADCVSPAVLLAGCCEVEEFKAGAVSSRRAERFRDRSFPEGGRAVPGSQETAMQVAEEIYRMSAGAALESGSDAGDARYYPGREHAERSWSTVSGIEECSTAEILYDLTTSTGNFFANGILVHNCDMTDMFLADYQEQWIDLCFAVMALTPHLTHQVLTKRGERLFDYLRDESRSIRVAGEARTLHATISPHVLPSEKIFDGRRVSLGQSWRIHAWPLPNVHVGVSVEDRLRKERIDWLRKTPAAVRFLSCEPLLEDLGDLDLSSGEEAWVTGIDWVITGAESGPGARPMEEEWVREIKNQCVKASVPFFYKQNALKGKKIPTHELDGQKWTQMPEVRP